MHVNPWEARLRTVATAAQPIFWKWTQLWPLYLLVLILWGVLQLLVFGQDVTAALDPGYLVIWSIAATVCTACFVAGPILETGLFLAGVRSRWVTILLFVVGCIVTIPCVVVITLFLAFAWTVTHQ